MRPWRSDMRSPNVITVLPFLTCLPAHPKRRPIWIHLSVLSAHSSRSATSRNIMTASQSTHSLTRTHCSSKHQTQWTPRHEPPFPQYQAARQPAQLTQLSSSRTGTRDKLLPDASLLSRLPSSSTPRSLNLAANRCLCNPCVIFLHFYGSCLIHAC